MKVQCPHCRKVLSVPDEYKDNPIRCPNCSEQVKPNPHAGVKSWLNLLRSLPKLVSGKAVVPKPVNSKPFKVLGTIGLLVSIGFAAAQGIDLRHETNPFMGLHANTYDGAPEFLIDTLTFAIVFLGCLMSFILIGIAKVIDAINANTLRREKKEQ